MFDAVLIANRGEIAIRVARACRELGVRAVGVYSEADRDAPHVRAMDEAFLLGPAAASESYLATAKVIDVARRAGVDAIHPGYGFLAENADFAQAVADAGLVFVGPPPAAIAAMGDKLSARAVARDAGVPVVPGTREPTDDPTVAIAFGDEYGYPVAVKAMFGGGGRGMKVVHDASQMVEALDAARREAQAAFGRGECYLERYLERPRHVEIQVLADLDGSTIYLGERDCSLQRRHQKLVEEAPAPGMTPELRAAMGQAAVGVAKTMGYTNAGTCEFLLDADGQTFYFLEMNTRLQVEHPVTEMITGIDLAQAQLKIAAGDGMHLTQDDIELRGHAIEVRINAEDPALGFVPTPGTIDEMTAPQGPWVRFDTGVRSGYTVPRDYDSMIGKLIVWATDRDAARARMTRALDELVLTGLPTTVPFHQLAMTHPQFAAGEHSTASVEHDWDLTALEAYDPEAATTNGTTMQTQPTGAQTVRDVELTLGGQPLYLTVYGTTRPDDRNAATARRQRQRGGPGSGRQHDGPELLAPMQGTIIKYAVEDGATVSAGDLVCVLEAMKMENHIVAHRAGTVTGLGFTAGNAVEQGATLARILEP
jgi:acetyl-CoA/propionyl-CoA carboxylase, biotin carboxylase, biotin carboxyl carrier protein